MTTISTANKTINKKYEYSVTKCMVNNVTDKHTHTYNKFAATVKVNKCYGYP